MVLLKSMVSLKSMVLLKSMQATFAGGFHHLDRFWETADLVLIRDQEKLLWIRRDIRTTATILGMIWIAMALYGDVDEEDNHTLPGTRPRFMGMS